MYHKINLMFNKFLKRNINQNEFNLINNQIKNKTFHFDNLLKNILHSKEFGLLCLQNISNIFKSIDYDIKTIKESIIKNLVKQMQNGTSIDKIKTNILCNFNTIKKKNPIKKSIVEKPILKTNNKVNINNIFQKVLKRSPNKKELSKYKDCTNSYELENTLLHTTECSKLIDKELKDFIRLHKI